MLCAERLNRIPTCLYSSVLLDGVGFRGPRVQARSDPPWARLSSGDTWPNGVVKVFVKVDADYGPIEVGELLTTSPTRGGRRGWERETA